MRRTVTIDLSDEDFVRLEREAAAASQTLSELIMQRLRGDSEPGDSVQAIDVITKADVEAALLASARRVAAQTGQTPQEALDEWRARLHPMLFPDISEQDKQRGLDRLRPFFGAFDSGDPNSVGNERKDADRARKYDRGRKREQ